MIYINDKPIKSWKFPAGESGVNIKDCSIYNDNIIKCLFESNDDIINLLFTVNAIKNINPNANNVLEIPYFPYARQDRVCSEGDSFSLQVVANLIKSCNFSRVICYDLHSEVINIVFEAGILDNYKQDEVLYDLVYKCTKGYNNSAIVAPDAGSLKKIYPLANKLNCDVIEASKVRDKATGKIISSSIDKNKVQQYNNLVLVDDICDGGRTFIELAKVIKEDYRGRLSLVVTHGIFSNGKNELNKYFDDVLCFNDMSNKEK